MPPAVAFDKSELSGNIVAPQRPNSPDLGAGDKTKVVDLTDNADQNLPDSEAELQRAIKLSLQVSCYRVGKIVANYYCCCCCVG